MIFKVQNVSKNFGGIKVSNNMSLEVSKGEIVGIMGPNGAGKTTLLNIISGLEKADSGEIFLNSERITNLEPHIIAKKGVRRSFQTTSNFPDETVEDNIRAAVISSKSMNSQQVQEAVNKILEEVDLLDFAKKIISEIPIACSKIVELCRCLVAKPVLVLLDELYAGLTLEESKTVTKLLKTKKQSEGISFLLIEHRTEILFDVVDRIVVISQGSNFFQGLPGEVLENKSVAELYWGK